MKVTDYIADYLVKKNIDIVFGYQGSSVSHLIDSIGKNKKLNFIEMRNEQAAAFAANGYALSSNNIGVALACSGPGALNLINGIANAFYDSIPCIFFTGQVSQHEMKNGASVRQVGFQETDVVSIVRPICKYAVTIKNASELVAELPKAFRIAVDGRPGPVVIDLPHNIQSADIILDDEVNDVDNETLSLNSTDDAIIDSLVNKLQCSRRPVFLIGGGCRNICLETQKKISNLKIPVVSSYLGKNNFDNKLSNYVGTLGVYGERSANWAVKYSDLVVVFGSRLDGRQTAGEALQKFCDNVVIIDIDKEELNRMPENYLKINGNAKSYLSKLAEIILPHNQYSEWQAAICKWKEKYSIEKEYHIKENVNPNLFLKYLSNLASDDAVFVLDVGQNQLWGNNSLKIGRNQCLLQSGGLGSMGYSLPAAIGAYLSKNQKVFSINGDGGIQMNIQELQTIYEYKLPIKIFVLNNNSLGLIRDYQNKVFNGRHYGSVLGHGNPDYELLAQAYGMDYMCIKDNSFEEDLEKIIRKDLACLVEVIVSSSSTAYPEPTYLSTIDNQSKVLSIVEREELISDVQKLM